VRLLVDPPSSARLHPSGNTLHLIQINNNAAIEEEENQP